MAAVVTTTNTLNITVGESSLQGVGQELTWKLDNPQQNLTMAMVQTEWAGIVQDCAPCMADGTPLIAVKKATTVQTVKTTEELV